MSDETPHDRRAEQAVLGSVFNRPEAIEDLADLSEDDMFLPAHREIFSAMRAIARNGKRVDVLTVGDEISRRGLRNALPDHEGYLLDLATSVPSADGLSHWVAIVRDKAIGRRLLLLGAEIQSRVRSGMPAEEITTAAIRDLTAVVAPGTGTVRLGDKMTEVLQVIEDRHKPEATNVIATGIGSFDRMFGGLRSSNLVVVAARPGMGKTAFAGTVARNVAKAGVPVLVFSLEMEFQELADRFLSAESGVDGQAISLGRLDRTQYALVYGAAGSMEALPLFVNDQMLTAPQIYAEARRWRAQQRNRDALVVVDYLGLIKSAERSETRAREVGAMAWTMKALAKSIKAPVMLVAQLNRKVDERAEAPRLSDLRDSGEIEQHANVVIFPWRSDPTRPGSGPADLRIEKNRSGVTGIVGAWWDAPTTTFQSAVQGMREGAES